MLIPNRNILDQSSQWTALSVGVAAGATTSPVKNTTGLTTSWAIQYGATGEEQTEIVIGTPTNIGTITHAALSFSHPADTPVYYIKFDQVVFERSLTGTAGVAAPLTNGTIGIRADGTVSIFDDTSGTPTYAYKTFYRNSSMSVNSIESDWITSAGFTDYSLASIRERAKRKLWNADYIDDDFIDDSINDWKDEWTNSAIQANEDYAIGTVAVGFGTAGLGTVISTDFKQPRRIYITYDGVNKFLSNKTTSNSFGPTTSFTPSRPMHNWQGDNIFQVHPSDTAGTAEIEYYKLNARLVNDTDEVPTPMKGYTKTAVVYVVAQAYGKDEKWDAYDRKMGEVNADKQTFISQISPRDKTGPTYIRITEPVEGDNYWPY